MRRLAVWILPLLLALAGPQAVQADTPTETVRRHLDRMHSIFKDTSLDAARRQAAVRTAIEGTFDFEETARRALGPHRARMTGPQRAAFATGLNTLLSDAYASVVDRFYSHREDALDAYFVYTNEHISGNQARVELKLLRQKEQLPVEAFLQRQGQRWRIYDVAVHGIRLTDNYRAQVDRLSRSGEYTGVLSRLERRPPEEPSQPLLNR